MIAPSRASAHAALAARCARSSAPAHSAEGADPPSLRGRCWAGRHMRCSRLLPGRPIKPPPPPHRPCCPPARLIASELRRQRPVSSSSRDASASSSAQGEQSTSPSEPWSSDDLLRMVQEEFQEEEEALGGTWREFFEDDPEELFEYTDRAYDEYQDTLQELMQMSEAEAKVRGALHAWGRRPHVHAWPAGRRPAQSSRHTHARTHAAGEGGRAAPVLHPGRSGQ